MIAYLIIFIVKYYQKNKKVWWTMFEGEYYELNEKTQQKGWVSIKFSYCGRLKNYENYKSDSRFIDVEGKRKNVLMIKEYKAAI